MKRFILFLIIASFSFGLQAKEIKVLAIGNSFSADAIEQNLYEIALADGDQLIIGNLYIGGCSLEKHYMNSVNDTAIYSYRKIVNGVKTETNHYRLTSAIKDENWDYITFQQSSPFSGIYNTYFPFLISLKEFVRARATNAKVKFGLHATWAYAKDCKQTGFENYNRNQMKMYKSIVNAANRAAKVVSMDFVIPAGTAIQNGRTSVIGDHFCRDGYHLQLNYGRYTAACTWYEVLLGKSVIGNRYRPAGITAEQAKIAQMSAHFAVINPQIVTKIKGK
ncbi:MAG: DUF4886 domain-containing protein [Bacteroidales bacterium]|nr:DUF4886 domain-containing protein [Bacteroidales bacterium]MDD4713229.1 DUF4886 domain-containing protein [Bacteroidales bacterium]